ncbi:MAG: MFS transporter [Chloroflexi bacterium]|nr:MFS transporter [Chloroflexota bacterium]
MDRHKYNNDFIRRRWFNIILLGGLYSSYYMIRYNFPLANKALCNVFGWSMEDIGWVITGFFWVYALGQLVNGTIADNLGGRKTILLGAFASVALNILIGSAQILNIISGKLGIFINTMTIVGAFWILNGYFQAFGASAMVKINTNWFARDERGRYNGVFVFIIQLGRSLIILAGGYLLAVSWNMIFIVPALVTLGVAVACLIGLRNNPEDIGFPPVEEKLEEDKTPFAETLKAVFGSPVIWAFALAYFTTGIVRHGLEQWFPRFFQDVHGMDFRDMGFWLIGISIPAAMVLGAYFSGYMSDLLFKTRRGPAIGVMYLGQIITLVLFFFTGGKSSALYDGLLLALLSFFMSGPHSLLGAVVAMDFGGRKGAGSAAGLIDCFQYLGAGFSGFFLGGVLDRFGWDYWAVFLAAASLAGFIFMLALWNAMPEKPAKDAAGES